jgi:tetratricopeptide (TPR) repeat protein
MFGFGYNKEKSRTKAERYLQQNKLQNAIAEYGKILQAEPRDLAILNTVGDIYSRLGQNEQAIERFRVVAEAYATEGVLLKSIAMYKKIVKLDPNGLPAMEKLAELYRKQGLVSDARSVLLQAAEAYTRKGQSKETLRLLKQLVLFDPENVQVITRTADLMNQGGQKDEAKQMLAQTASTLVGRHALEPAQKILDRLIALDRGNLRAQELRAQVTFELGDTEKAAELYEAIPDIDSRVDGLRNLLAAYLKLGNLEKALPVGRKLTTVHHDPDGVMKVASHLYKEDDTLGALNLYNEFSSEVLAHDKEEVLAHLHGAISKVRTNPEALQILYRLFQRAGESSMLAEILELEAHACVQNGKIERARDAYKELIELEPENAAHLQAYRQLCARLDPATAPAPGGAKSDAEPRTLEEFLSADDPTLPAQSYPPSTEEVITTALAEAELCESFASKKSSINGLEIALQSAPEDLRLNRTLGLLYHQEGESAKAAHCYSIMQRVLENLGESEAAAHYANLAGTSQTNTWEAKSGEFAARDFDLAANPEVVASGDEEIDLSGEWETIWQDASALSAPPSPAPPAPVSTESIPELVEEVRFCLSQQIWSEAEAAIARLSAASPGHPELPAFTAELRRNHPAFAPAALPVSPPQYSPVEVIEVSSESSPSSAPLPPSAPAPTLSSLAAELDFELGDSFVPTQQPRRDPPTAKPNLAEPQPSSAEPIPAPFVPPPFQPMAAPASPFVLDEVDLFQAPPPPVPSPEAFVPYAAAATEASAEPIAEAAPPPTPSVFGDLLQDFERDLATPEDDNNDPETHFNLGIAFREMGLLDEAIGELQKVCRLAGRGLSPARTQQAYIWLATCFVEKSVPEASFKWFLRAIEAAPDEESRTAVNYELASAYAAAGMKREALDRYMEVYGTNIDYRDVASRIRELRSAV